MNVIGHLCVDVHQDGRLREALQSLNPEVREMETGDYAWVADDGKRVGVESKTVTDLISSFASGRLTDQISRMIATYDVPLLLVVGHIDRLSDKHVAASSNVDMRVQASSLRLPFISLNRSSIKINVWHSALQNFLLSAQTAGLFIDFVSGEMARAELESARLTELIAYFDKPEHTSIKRNKLHVPFSKHPRQAELDVLRALPGISDVIAERLLTHFGTVAAVVAADAMALGEVCGVGPGKAERVWSMLRGNV